MLHSACARLRAVLSFRRKVAAQQPALAQLFQAQPPAILAAAMAVENHR